MKLEPDMRIEDFETRYWMKDELIEFARRLGLRADGNKPALTERIKRHLLGQPPLEQEPKPRSGPRDSDRPLTRERPVVNYRNDDRTSEFFESEIGPHFHFTYHLNRYRRTHEGLTYGDLIDEWLAERERRKGKNYKPKLAKHGEYNLFVRDFFADPDNKGRTMRDAADAWNTVKPTSDRSYESYKKHHK